MILDGARATALELFLQLANGLFYFRLVAITQTASQIKILLIIGNGRIDHGFVSRFGCNLLPRIAPVEKCIGVIRLEPDCLAVVLDGAIVIAFCVSRANLSRIASL